MKNSSNVFLGFLAGAATGAIAGVLMAPDKGKNTRQNLANRASQLTDDLNASVQKGFDKLDTFKDSVFSLVNKYGEEARSNVSEAFKNAQNP